MLLLGFHGRIQQHLKHIPQTIRFPQAQHLQKLLDDATLDLVGHSVPPPSFHQTHGRPDRPTASSPINLQKELYTTCERPRSLPGARHPWRAQDGDDDERGGCCSR
jgi:hypothetical protein